MSIEAFIIAGMSLAFLLGIAAGGAAFRSPSPAVNGGAVRASMDTRSQGDEHVSIDTVIVAAPVVDDPVGGRMNLRSWAQQYHPQRDGVWTAIVKTFYELAAADPDVADYFGRMDMVPLQKHFVQVLVALTQRGLTMRMIQRLGDSHTYVANSVGVGITDSVFDKVGAALEGALRSQGVPEDTIDQVAEMLVPIRSAMVQRTYTS
jgi:hemoglobin